MNESDQCAGGNCGCGGQGVSRRDLLILAAAGALVPNWPLMAGPFVDADFARLVPADKKLQPAWVAALSARGEPRVYRGSDLRFIGMPVGGLFCGTVYLSGDGRLWLWDVFNRNQVGVSTREVKYRGAGLGPMQGSSYVEPLVGAQHGEVEQGFSIRVKTEQATLVRSLDADGFAEVSFRGAYPIGTIRYADPAMPVVVTLEAFSPFIPLNVDESSLPATIFAFRIENRSSDPVEVELTGSLENAACRGAQYWTGKRVNRVEVGERETLVRGFVEPASELPVQRPDVVFEDWSKPGYAGWQVQGEAFGGGPIARGKIPAYQGDVGGDTPNVVNSHAGAGHGDVSGNDAAVGKLTSSGFVIARRFINFWIGGGAHEGRTCVNLLVGGQVVRSQTGRNENRMTACWFDVRTFEGKEAKLEIVDDERGPWGNVGVGRITFSDRPAGAVEAVEQSDFGTVCLAVLGRPAEIHSGNADVLLDQKLTGALGRRMTIAAGKTGEATFVVAWHFPNVGIVGQAKRHYAKVAAGKPQSGLKFADAAAVARYVSEHFERLAAQTRLWRDTWYDSTLPYWFLDRTFANASTLATTTCHRFSDGRFWAWEGIGCCAGTCTHVWHYAQALARLFPEVERDQRERVDFGLAWQEDGVIRFRAEHGATFAADGQAGRILGAYREHQMSSDDAFLQRVWPRVRKSIERLMHADPEKNGLLRGPLHNTLDADWFGYVPWLCGLYAAALRAGEAMAGEVSDAAFAARCRAILDVAAGNLDRTCWSEDYRYYVHRGDDAHASEVGAYDGCHIDQVFGQGWARQVGLGEVMTPGKVKAALQSIWTYNFTPDVGPFRAVKKEGRWYALAGDGGTIMVAYPFKSTRTFAGGGAWSAMYFNECMSGFEHQVASHMMWEGMVTEALAATRVIHDRYDGRLRNPYNEVECSDHYARAMASYGTYLAACGFECHGPRGHIGFAPRVGAPNFKAAFTAAEGWGTYTQMRTDATLQAGIELKQGRLRVRTIALCAEGNPPTQVKVTVGDEAVPATMALQGTRVVITLETPTTIDARKALHVVLT